VRALCGPFCVLVLSQRNDSTVSKKTRERKEIRSARVDSVQFGNGSTVVVPKSGVEAGVQNDALRPRVAVPRLLRGKRASRK
jgi:hypothetical protein